MPERVSVLVVKWDEPSVFDVSREIVNGILLRTWGRESDWYKVNEQIKESFDEQKDVAIKRNGANLFVKLSPPRPVIFENENHTFDLPHVQVCVEPINSDLRRYKQWQKLQSITNLMKSFSPYYNLSMHDSLNLTFSPDVYGHKIQFVSGEIYESNLGNQE